MGINAGSINKGGGVITELTVINGATIDSTTLVVDDANDRVGIGTDSPGTMLQLEGTAPYITLKNSTAENSAGGCEAKITFEDHGDNALGLIEVSHEGTSDDEKGQMIFKTNNDSGLQTALTIASDGKITSARKFVVNDKLTVGEDDTGYDVQFFGATTGAYMLWDEDVDDLILGGAARMVIPDGQLVLGSTAVGATAAEINAACDASARTAATVAVADDHFLFCDGGATGATKVESIADLVSGIASSGLKASSGTLSNNRCNMNLIDDNLTLAASHNGRAIFVKELGENKTITLPTPAAGYMIKIVYLHNNQDYDVIIKAAADTTFMYGLIGRLDFGGAGSGFVNSPNSYSGVAASTYIGGVSHETNNTLTITDALAGTFMEFYSDGTSWYLHGVMISSTPNSTASFSQGDY